MSPTQNQRRSGQNSSAEERAEALMERVVNDSSRVLGRVFGRVREEVEDIVAEARTMNDRSRNSKRS